MQMEKFPWPCAFVRFLLYRSEMGEINADSVSLKSDCHIGIIKQVEAGTTLRKILIFGIRITMGTVFNTQVIF